MNYRETMATLKSLGTAQGRKIYARHGAGDNLFGVPFADLYKLQKKIKQDHKLALSLWKSGNCEARILATLIADPEEMTPALAEEWLKSLSYFMIVDYFAGLVSKTSFGKKKAKVWMSRKGEFVRQAGYNVCADLLKRGGAYSVEEGQKILETIEAEIHESKNRARYAMNSTLISLGIYMPELRPEVLKAAKRVGKVHVEFSKEVSCKVPDAVPYIKEAVERLKKKKKVS